MLIVVLSGLSSARGQSLMSPSAHGMWGGSVFSGAGITAPQVGSGLSDMTGVMGIGFGNPYKNCGIQLSTWINDVSEQKDFSLCLKFHRKFDPGSAIALGLNHFWVQKGVQVNDNYYAVISHDFSYNFPDNKVLGSLAFSFGYGTGKFSNYGLSDQSFNNSGLFGTASYSILKVLKWELEWDGFELNTGFKLSGRILKLPVGLMIGAADLTTKYSGKTRVIAAFGIGYDIW